MTRYVARSGRFGRETWHADHSNIVTLLYWAEAEGFSARDIVRIVEKPAKWRAEFVVAYCRSADAHGRRPRPAVVASPAVLPMVRRVACPPTGRRGA